MAAAQSQATMRMFDVQNGKHVALLLSFLPLNLTSDLLVLQLNQDLNITSGDGNDVANVLNIGGNAHIVTARVMIQLS